MQEKKPFYSTLIDVQTLFSLGDAPLILDVRHQLNDPDWGQNAFNQAHIPNSHFLSIDKDLSGSKAGNNGRHPLPVRAHFVKQLQALGLRPSRQVVVLDQNNGMMAARLWWMIKHWLQHPQVALLNGGWDAWQAWQSTAQTHGAENTTAKEASTAASATDASVTDTINLDTSVATNSTVDAQWILQHIVQAQNSPYLLVDARANERYLGKSEAIDPVAGHIPKAINRPATDNVSSNGLFKPPAQLRTEWQTLVGTILAHNIVMQCGSGITACHNLLALEVAGLGSAKLYVGSWSEWCTHPELPKIGDGT